MDTVVVRPDACIIAAANGRDRAMMVLAFDCATVRHSAALWQDGCVLAQAASERAHGATESLVPMLDRVMREAGCDFSRLDRLVVTVGPGHFTGLRAGLAVARALALAAGLPVVAVTTFEAVAVAVAPEEIRGRRLLVAIDSKRAEPYLQMFGEDMAPLGDAVSLPVDDYAAAVPSGLPITVAGDAAAPLVAALRAAGHDAMRADAPAAPDAASLAAFGASRAPAAGPVRPFYLHPPAVKIPAAGRVGAQP
jgi:tRNA threonylcarbamoyladenosine biosynthesis protein TsaB